ncbi:MAG: hypothetical protein HWQ35_05235 [Nostoc sp. NMS1]|uniref:hypothetical protein n=1 Tax=unclassified Nostoc TaxID=2593658 RepID=UPI0025F3263B|nr:MULTISPECIES: hypothetical protein [unclassified Nostoc]MBN3905968.1 hypothetical protein [Nostoc sp. NMS1]MBN3994742.1 hypothetical protein [Nostoc sp. NMS2]
MNRLEISNLSFCEIASNQKVDLKGGFSLGENFRYRDISLYLNWFVFAVPVEFTPEQVYSGSDVIVNKLVNQPTGTSGYTVSNKDGTSQAGVITGRNSKISFASSVYYSY